MAKTTAPLLPATERQLQAFAARLRAARLRRRLTAKQVAQRAGMTPMTLRALERGRPGVTMGAYVGVMQVLGMESDLERLAENDLLGRQLQDSALLRRRRATSPTGPGATAKAIVAPATSPRPDQAETGTPRQQPARKTARSSTAGGPMSSDALAELLK